jgi:glycerol-3-phosphate dehydrogenase subunit C
VTYFAGCFARYNEPASVGRNTVLMAEKLGYQVKLPRTRCSGHALETYGGDLGPWARHNIEALEGSDPILTTCSSCRLSLVKQYPEWFSSDPHWKKRALSVAARVVDAAYFGAGHLSKDRGGQRIEAAYHAPCHALYLSETGHPGGEEALRAVTAYADVQQSCSGMGGTFGFKKQHRTIAEKNAERMIGHLEHLPLETTLYTDCPSCRLALDERTDRPVDHPVNAVYRLVCESQPQSV